MDLSWLCAFCGRNVRGIDPAPAAIHRQALDFLRPDPPKPAEPAPKPPKDDLRVTPPQKPWPRLPPPAAPTLDTWRLPTQPPLPATIFQPPTFSRVRMLGMQGEVTPLATVTLYAMAEEPTEVNDLVLPPHLACDFEIVSIRHGRMHISPDPRGSLPGDLFAANASPRAKFCEAARLRPGDTIIIEAKNITGATRIFHAALRWVD